MSSGLLLLVGMGIPWLPMASNVVEAQRRMYRLPAGLLLPPVMTVGVRPG